jgi:hypothetical protein
MSYFSKGRAGNCCFIVQEAVPFLSCSSKSSNMHLVFSLHWMS